MEITHTEAMPRPLGRLIVLGCVSTDNGPCVRRAQGLGEAGLKGQSLGFLLTPQCVCGSQQRRGARPWACCGKWAAQTPQEGTPLATQAA